MIIKKTGFIQANIKKYILQDVSLSINRMAQTLFYVFPSVMLLEFTNQLLLEAANCCSLGKSVGERPRGVTKEPAKVQIPQPPVTLTSCFQPSDHLSIYTTFIL